MDDPTGNMDQEIFEKRVTGGWNPEDYPDDWGAREFEKEWRKNNTHELTATEALIYAVGLPIFAGIICYILSSIEF